MQRARVEIAHPTGIHTVYQHGKPRSGKTDGHQLAPPFAQHQHEHSYVQHRQVGEQNAVTAGTRTYQKRREQTSDQSYDRQLASVVYVREHGHTYSERHQHNERRRLREYAVIMKCHGHGYIKDREPAACKNGTECSITPTQPERQPEKPAS